MKKRYEEVMEQLTVTDEMRERILKNVSEEMTDASSAALEPVSDNPPASDNPVSPTPKKRSTARIHRFPALQGVLAAAACAALVFLMRGLLVQRHSAYADQGSVMSEAAGRSVSSPEEKRMAEAKESAVSIANGMEDVSSDEALSQAVGFAVPDIAGDLAEVLSFTGEETVYTSYWGEMAQITYRGTVSDDVAGDSGKTSRKDPSKEAAADSDSAADHASGDAATDGGSGGASDEFCFRISEGTEDNSGDYNTYADVRTVTAGDCRVTLKGNGEKAVLAIWSAGGYSYSLSAPQGLTDREWESLIARISEGQNP